MSNHRASAFYPFEATGIDTRIEPFGFTSIIARTAVETSEKNYSIEYKNVSRDHRQRFYFHVGSCHVFTRAPFFY